MSDLKQRLVAVSLDVIAEHGLEALSMREVARRADVSHQAPYKHFADREAVLAAVTAEGFRRLAAALVKSGAKKRDPWEKVLALGGVYVSFAISNPDLFRLMYRTGLIDPKQHPDCAASVAASINAFNDRVSVVIRQLVDVDDPDLSIVFWSMAHGLANLLIEGRLARAGRDSPRDQKHTMQEVVDALRRVLARWRR